jgi:predicted transposase YdaD
MADILLRQKASRFFREITEQEETHMLAEYIREKGRTEGMAQGMAQGMEKGRTQGMTEGICKEKFQTILNLRKFNMQPADIAQITRLTPEKVAAVLAAGDGGLDLLIREDQKGAFF